MVCNVSIRRGAAVLVALTVLLAAGVALAGGGGASGSFWDRWGLVLSHAFNLAILLWILVRFAGPPVVEALKKRSESIGQEIQEAGRLHAEAREMLEGYDARLAGLEAQADELLTEYRHFGETERDRLIAEGVAEAERIRVEAEQVARNELSRAREQLESEVVDRAIEIAQGLIQSELSEDDHHRLTTDYFANLEDSLRS